MNTPFGYCRRYLPTGKVTHLVPDEPNSWTTALCGQDCPWGSDWLGTGTQAEYEELAARPPCKSCERRRAA